MWCVKERSSALRAATSRGTGHASRHNPNPDPTLTLILTLTWEGLVAGAALVVQGEHITVREPAAVCARPRNECALSALRAPVNALAFRI